MPTYCASPYSFICSMMKHDTHDSTSIELGNACWRTACCAFGYRTELQVMGFAFRWNHVTTPSTTIAAIVQRHEQWDYVPRNREKSRDGCVCRLTLWGYHVLNAERIKVWLDIKASALSRPNRSNSRRRFSCCFPIVDPLAIRTLLIDLFGPIEEE